MFFPLSVRLTLFYTLILALALWFFGPMVYHQAEQNAYQNLRDTLQSRATSVQYGKFFFLSNNTHTPGLPEAPVALPSVDVFGKGGVGIEVLAVDDTGQPTRLLATSAGTPESAQLTVTGLGTVPTYGWSPAAIRQVIQQHLPELFTEITSEGQRILVYTREGGLIPTGDQGFTRSVIQTAHSEQDIQQTLDELRQTMLNGAILVLAFALSGSLFISWGLLAPVRRMSRSVRRISASKNFSQRIPEKTRLGRDELTMLAATFNQMLTSLEKSYKQQQRFVADASHELRAPITSIRCNLDLLTKAPDLPTEEVREALADARSEAERMGRLVNDLLLLAHNDEMSQLSSPNGYKNTRPHRQKVDLDSLLLDVFRQYRPQEEDEQKAPGPRLLLQHITPVQVDGDADQLKQALVVLVDNALKYTPPEGLVSLALSADANCAIVKVSDSGIGIASEDLPHIFERFYRANRARTRDRGGSGLGLAIAQSIIQEHGGSIEVESTPGKGSIFTFSILKRVEKEH